MSVIEGSEVDQFLHATRSEVKRWGGSEPGLAHLAFVLSKRWPDAFDEVFGATGRTDVEALLRARAWGGAEKDVLDVLRMDGADQAAVLVALRERLETARTERAVPDTAVPDTAVPETAVSETAVPEPRPLSDAAASEPTVVPDSLDTPSTSVRQDWTVPFTHVLEVVEPRDDLLDHDVELAEIAAQLTRTLPQPVIVVGDAGTGRTALLAGVAARLSASGAGRRLFRISTESPIDADILHKILTAAPDTAVIAVDDLDSFAWLDGPNPSPEFLRALLAAGRHSKAGLLMTIETRLLSRLEMIVPELVRTAVRVALGHLPEPTVTAIVEDGLDAITHRYGVAVDPALLVAVVTPPSSKDHLAHPALAFHRLDSALARAAVAGQQVATTANLLPSGVHTSVEQGSVDLATSLATRIRGQDQAIEAVARRLTLTRTGLDLRPERPNGVFLFVGPTGVGKTELAREIARVEYGGLDRLLRLDMSEYSHDWAVSRIVGPMPGYVGSTEPESWLTTRVAANPHCVVLLDEIEKAHPTVWNVFLQVFDAGRLTDSRGTTADFRDAIVIMTSNLGVREASHSGVGFSDHTQARTDRLVETLRQHMAPELLNRMDEIAVFNELDPAAIRAIARAELSQAVDRLAAQGWELDLDPEVVDWLATTGYDPAFGARHLQRNLEREFLAALATASSRRLSVSVGDGGLVVASKDA